MRGAPQNLRTLLEGLFTPLPELNGEITGLSLDSRTVQPGFLFLALPGTQQRGHEFISAAIERGAVVVLYDASCEAPKTDCAVPCVGVRDLPRYVGLIAARFYDHPSLPMRIIGVTGTNGKTSTCHFIAQGLRENVPCGVIGTLGNGLYGETLTPSSHTTPDAITLQAQLAAWRAVDVKHVVMEVSSHALSQHRIEGTRITTAVFTNLSRDHLDYHGDMAAYAAAKRRLFELPTLQHAIVNLDDAFGAGLFNTLPNTVQTLGYTLSATPNYPPDRTVSVTRFQLDGAGVYMEIRTPWGEGVIRSALIGRHNTLNMLAALCALVVNGVHFHDAIYKLHRLVPVPGRMEVYGNSAEGPWVVVDYAHTPDALSQVLNTLREYCRGRLWVVFGCGGERDVGKRPLMGEIAQRLADKVILTDDNPRREPPSAIIKDILQGMRDPQKVPVMHGRARAIHHAVTQAASADVVLIAGKGHEEYQIIGAEKHPFRDGACVEAALAARAQLQS